MEIERKWYALYVKSRHEKKTAGFLEEKELEVFLPLIKTKRQWSDRIKKVEIPLFNSYVFVKLFSHEFEKVQFTPGFVGFVKVGGLPHPIPEVQIQAVKTFIGQPENYDHQVDFAEGDEVEVAYGDLKGLRGTLIRIDGKQKLIVQIEIVHQNITLTVAPHLLKPLKIAPRPKVKAERPAGGQGN